MRLSAAEPAAEYGHEAARAFNICLDPATDEVKDLQVAEPFWACDGSDFADGKPSPGTRIVDAGLVRPKGDSETFRLEYLGLSLPR